MLKNKFIKLSLIEKIELYFIILIFFTITFIIIQNIVIVQDTNISVKQKLYVKNLSDKIVIKKQKEIMDYIETTLGKFNLFVQSIVSSDNAILITINSPFDTAINLLQLLEQHLIIEELSFNKIDAFDDIIQTKIVIGSYYFLNKNQKNKESISVKDPFHKKPIEPSISLENKPTKKVHQDRIQIDAIVANEVLIEGDWYKEGDIFHKRFRVKIEPTVVKFVDNQSHKTITIRLESDEN